MSTEQDRFQEYARTLLRIVMRDISETGYCAGWLTGHEFQLWEEVTKWLEDDADPWGEYGMVDVDREYLYTLAKDAGGWYYWSDDDGHGEQFIDMVDWLIMYNDYLGRKNGLRDNKA